MGQYDAIKATASGGFTNPIEFKFKPLDYSVSGITLNRLPGETDAAYMLRLKAVNDRHTQNQKRQEAYIQYQKDKLKKEEEHEQKLRQENTDYLTAKCKALLSGYDTNDMNSLKRVRSEIAGLKNFYTFNKVNKDFSIYNLKKTDVDNDWRIFNLQRGEENDSCHERSSSDSKNLAGFDFQPEFHRNMSA